METELISIIVPVYNVEDYIAETIESVIAQTYQNWELLLVNDGSTDSSGEICEKFALQDKRIKYFSISNLGACVARNIGLQNANGEYLMFMDADDFLSIDCLQFLYDIILENNVDIASGNCQSIINGNIRSYTKLHKNDIVKSDVMLNDILNYQTITAIWGKLYKASVIKDIQFSPSLKVGQDIDYLCKVFLQKKDILTYRSCKIVYNYRILSNSISHNKFGQLEKLKSYIDALIAIYNDNKEQIIQICPNTFADNLGGSILRYYANRPFLKKLKDLQYFPTLHSLYRYLEPIRKKRTKILLTHNELTVSIYFSWVYKYERIKNFINRATSKLLNI